MSAAPADNSAKPSERDPVARTGVLHQFGSMLRAIFAPPVRRALLAITLTIVFILILTAYCQIRLNSWNKPFYDALSRRDFGDFLFQLGVFSIIAGALLVLAVAKSWLV